MHSAVIPWLDPNTLIEGFGPYAIIGLGLVVFAETGLLIGFLLPGDTLLISAGILSVPGSAAHLDITLVCLSISVGAILGGEAGYWIGHKSGPRIFQKSEGGLFSKKNVERTNSFFVKYGLMAVIIARFVPVVRTFAPVAAGVGNMPRLKYSLYNFVGAIIWGTGLTLLGYWVGHIPVVAYFVQEYIDLVLLGVIVVVLLPTIYHYVQAFVKARRAKHRHSAEALDQIADPEELVLDPSVFDSDHHGAHADDSK